MHLLYSVKVAYSGDNSVKAVLLKDKNAKAESGSKPQQYIEVSQTSTCGSQWSPSIRTPLK